MTKAELIEGIKVQRKVIENNFYIIPANMKKEIRFTRGYRIMSVSDAGLKVYSKADLEECSELLMKIINRAVVDTDATREGKLAQIQELKERIEKQERYIANMKKRIAELEAGL